MTPAEVDELERLVAKLRAAVNRYAAFLNSEQREAFRRSFVLIAQAIATLRAL